MRVDAEGAGCFNKEDGEGGEEVLQVGLELFVELWEFVVEFWRDKQIDVGDDNNQKHNEIYDWHSTVEKGKADQQDYVEYKK